MADPVPQNALTPNYSFNQPAVGGDDNVWGGLLNDNWASVDTILWSVSGVASAALTPTTGDARYLKLNGGTLTGSLIAPVIVAPNLAGTTGGAPPALINGPNPGDNSQTVPTTSWVNQAVSTAIGAIPVPPTPPSPSNANPAMDGTAAPGTSALYARGDHVHPTDTSRAAASALAGYLPLTGGTLTGALTLAADPAASLQPATKQYVDAGGAAITATGAGMGGFVNKLRNASFDIWQRGTALTATNGAFLADGWLLTLGGTAGTAGRMGILPAFPGAPRAGLSLTGVAGTTAWNVAQRIESWVAAPLAGQVCTFSCWIMTNLAGGFTPGFTVNHPTAADNWASSANDVSVSLQPVPGGSVWTRVAYTFLMPQANQGLGAGITIGSGGANLGANSVWITACDLRATPGLPVGLNANPPPPELRPYPVELAYCQRYYESSNSVSLFSGNVTSTATYWSGVSFKNQKRASPTMTLADAGSASSFPSTAPTLGLATADGFSASKTANATSTGLFIFNWTASAEL